MDVIEMLLIAAGMGLAALLLAAIAGGRLRGGRAGMAPLTAWHDFQPLDKQHATEIVVEQKAGKRWTEQESGDAGRTGQADRTGGDDPDRIIDASGGATPGWSAPGRPGRPAERKPTS
jgi:hypothetical protein